LALVVLAATAIAAATAGTASANREIELSVASGELGRVRADSLALTLADPEGAAEIICEVNFTMAPHRRILKSRDSLLGFVNVIGTRNCRGGGLTWLDTPCHMRLVSWSGMLPGIISIRARRICSVLVRAFFGIAECLYSGSFEFTTEGSPVTAFRMDESVQVPLADESLSSIACPGSLIARGTLRVNPSLRLRLT
jgi:hypothetical protein